MTTDRVSDAMQNASDATNEAGEGSADLPIEEIYDRYPLEWVAVKVTARDENHRTSRGIVIAHGPEEREVSMAVVQAHRQDPSICTSMFLGGHRATSTEEWREQLAEARKLGPRNAFWSW